MLDLSPTFHPDSIPIPKTLDHAYKWRFDALRGWLLKSRMSGFTYSPQAARTLFAPLTKDPGHGRQSD